MIERIEKQNQNAVLFVSLLNLRFSTVPKIRLVIGLGHLRVQRIMLKVVAYTLIGTYMRAIKVTTCVRVCPINGIIRVRRVCASADALQHRPI